MFRTAARALVPLGKRPIQISASFFRDGVGSSSPILQRFFSAIPERVVDLDTNAPDLIDHDKSNAVAPSSGGAASGRPGFTQLPATKQGQKPRVVVLGSGWAACRLMKGLNTDIYDVVCISPRNHMVFTPLLASTCVGTLEFRSVSEPVWSIQPALSRSPTSYYFHAYCTKIDPENHEVYCETMVEDGSTLGNWPFKVAYDKLVIASGADPLTFGVKGVTEYASFLREVPHAREIRNRLLLNLMLSDIPGVPEEEKRRLLHCVVVGGGPTGVEFSGELSDFIRRDVYEKYGHVKDYIHVTLIEANEILSSFDVGLRQYAINHLAKAGVSLRKGVVKEVYPDKLILADKEVVPFGLLVWSTGVGASELVKSLPFEKSKGGRIGVDEHLRVPGHEDIYAIGDCAGHLKQPILPALAQVAERQGRYMSEALNKLGQAGGGRAGEAGKVPLGEPFVYKHLGGLVSVGRYKALFDMRSKPEAKGIKWAGFISWLVWRSAYLTRVVSWRGRLYVAVNWATTFIFGRDTARFSKGHQH